MVIFQDTVGLCSAISFKRSRRELSTDVAEQRSTLKNYHNTHYRRFSFIPKSGSIPRNGVFFFFFGDIAWHLKLAPLFFFLFVFLNLFFFF